jgi:hypothetical protein
VLLKADDTIRMDQGCNFMNHCHLCGKPINDDDERFGADCRKRYQQALLIIETTEAEIGSLFLLNNKWVNWWLTKVPGALITYLKCGGRKGMRALESAKSCIRQARNAAISAGEGRRTA